MMKTITLNILAEDINNSSYFDTNECAITRALRRAGIHADDNGLEMKHDNGERFFYNRTLSIKAREMYRFANPHEHPPVNMVKPQDFTYSLEVPDNW